VSFGIINAHTDPGRRFPAGQLWFNELRASDVDKTAGRAQRVTVSGNLANLLSYNVNWNGRDANFITVGQSIGSGASTDQLSFGSSLDLHRFFEGTGIILPLRYQLTRNASAPRFTAGDDVVRTGAAAKASETSNETRTWSTSYSRSWSDRSNPFLRYTIGGIGASASLTESETNTPTTVNEGRNFAASVAYNVSLRKLLTFRVPGTKINVFPLPEQAYWTYSLNTNRSATFDRLQDSTGTLRERSRVVGRQATLAIGMTSRPIDLLSHQIQATRNLTLRDDLLEKIGFMNFGRVVNWRQGFNSRYQFRGRTSSLSTWSVVVITRALAWKPR
jgi:cell surface protein SprA